jgi:transcriptional regulator with XRE-family HTH domain
MDKFSVPAIKKAMIAKNISTQKELIALTKLSPSTISRVFAGKAKPEAKTITALSKTLGMTHAQLFGEEPEKPAMDLEKEVYLEIKGKVYATPLRFSTGHGLGRFIRGRPGEQDCYALEVEGDSMSPVYQPGELIVCRPHKAELSPYAETDEDATFVPYEHVAKYNNRDAVVCFNGETNLKRIQIERGKGPKYDVYMKSVNEKYPRVKVHFGDVWEIQALVIRKEIPEIE